MGITLKHSAKLPTEVHFFVELENPYSEEDIFPFNQLVAGKMKIHLLMATQHRYT